MRAEPVERLARIAAGALAAASLLIGCAPQPTDDEDAAPPDPASALIDVGGFHLHFQCQGEGSPVVVLDAGISETYRSWGDVVQGVSRETRVCGFDRAGYGESEPGPFPRTALQVTSELAALLAGAGAEMGIAPPYLMVGHSLGAVHSLVFAQQHPELVVGVVVIDPPPVGFLSGERFPELGQMFRRQIEEFTVAAGESRAGGEEAQAIFFETMASEQEMLRADSLEQLAEVENLRDLPLIVISAGVPNPAFGDDAAEFQAFWIESNQEVAALSDRGRFILAAQSGHHVHLDDPGVVITAILELARE